MHTTYKRYGSCFAAVIGISLISLHATAQVKDSLPVSISLEQCVAYAIKHQPYIQQASIDESITDRTIKSKLADWYPQVNLGYNIEHYMQQPSATNPYVLKNVSTTNVSVSQNIFNSDVLLATKTAGDVRQYSRQTTQLSKIDMVVLVSKAFYDVLVTRKQIDILDQDIVRLQKSLKDATKQYEAGTSDKTDYKRATITLNNAVASKVQYEELLKGKLAYLKQQMGYTGPAEFNLIYDDHKLQDQVKSSSTSSLSYAGRVEFQQLETQRALLKYNLKYAKWSYLPTVSLFGNYNLIGQSQVLSKLYSVAYPNSMVGLTVTVPIFQGTKRIQGIKIAELELQRLDWDFQNLKATINTEYTSALTSYRSNLSFYTASQNNLSLAQEVYATINLQYMSGVKTYLDVIVAETDLRTAEVNSLNALFMLLSSKLDLEKATGTINY